MEKKVTINLCLKILAGILIAVGLFMAVPFTVLAVEIILGKLVDPEVIDLPLSLKRFGLSEIQANNPGLLTTYVVSYFFVLIATGYGLAHVIGRAIGKLGAMNKIERIVCWAFFAVSLCVLVPTNIKIMKSSKHALQKTKEENRDTYMGIKMDDFSRIYFSKNDFILSKHENCSSSYVRKGEYFTGDPNVGYLDSWNANAQQIYQAEKHQPVEPGTYRIICSARAEGAGCYVFATTSSKKYGVKLVEVPHYGNTEGEIWENAPEGSAEKEANSGNGFGWSKVVVTIQIDSHDTLIYGVTTDSKFTGKPYRSKWFSAADFEVERGGIN